MIYFFVCLSVFKSVNAINKEVHNYCVNIHGKFYCQQVGSLLFTNEKVILTLKK